MENKTFKPLVDKLFWVLCIPLVIFMIFFTWIMIAFSEGMLLFALATDAVVAYFLISPLFGYVELRRETLYIRYGFFLRKEIPYQKIRSLQKGRKWYSESMMALKNSMEHINIRYNAFDITTVSVVDNDAFLRELQRRCHFIND